MSHSRIQSVVGTLLALLLAGMANAQANPNNDTAYAYPRAARETEVLTRYLDLQLRQVQEVRDVQRFYFLRYRVIRDQDHGNANAREQKFSALQQQRLSRMRQRLTGPQYARYTHFLDSLRQLIPNLQ